MPGHHYTPAEFTLQKKGQLFRQSSFSIEREPFDAHLLGGFSFLLVREYQISGVMISQHRRILIEGIFRGVVTRGRGLIYISV